MKTAQDSYIITIKQIVRFQERMHLEKFQVDEIKNGRLSAIIHLDRPDTVVPPDATPFKCDFSYYATFFRSTDVLYTVKHPLNATSPLPRHATFKSWHYLATSL